MTYLQNFVRENNASINKVRCWPCFIRPSTFARPIDLNGFGRCRFSVVFMSLKLKNTAKISIGISSSSPSSQLEDRIWLHFAYVLYQKINFKTSVRRQNLVTLCLCSITEAKFQDFC